MTAHSRLASIPALLLVFAPLSAQEGMAGPAPELAKLKPMLGHWEGSGTATMPGAKGPSKWQSQSSYQWVLGGHFLQEETYVTFEGQEQPLTFRAFLGFDREQKRYVTVMASNTGEVTHQEMSILPDGAFVSIMRQLKQGLPVVERSRTRIDGDTSTFSIDTLSTDGAVQEMVKGTMKRVPKGRAHAAEATLAMVPAAEPMAKVARMAGTYAIDGSYVMDPSAKPMKMTGTSTIALIFGGTVLQVHETCKSDQGDYETWGFMAWDAEDGCYRNAMVDSMGMVGKMDGRFTADGKAMIVTGSGTMGGVPTASRFVMELNDKGHLVRGVGHSLSGTDKPSECFTGTYTRK